MSENGVCKPVDGMFKGKPDIYLSLGVITICLTLNMGTYDWWSYVPLYTATIMSLYIYIYIYIQNITYPSRITISYGGCWIIAQRVGKSRNFATQVKV